MSLFNDFQKFNFSKWFTDCRSICRLVSEVPGLEKGATEKYPPYAVVVTPWLETSVPWFTILCGLLLSKRNRVTFIFDNLPFGNKRNSFLFQAFFIQIVFFVLNNNFKTIKLSKFKINNPLSQDEKNLIQKYVSLNVVWQFRGEAYAEGVIEYSSASYTQLAIAYSAIHNLLNHHNFDAILFPGGIWGNSSMWAELCRQKGIRISTFDYGGKDALMLCCSGLATQLQDQPRALILLKEQVLIDHHVAKIKNEALKEINRKREGVDRNSSQITKNTYLTLPSEPFILLPLNSSWDSAALGLHNIFSSSTEWLIETLRVLLKDSKVTIVVRQHPAERAEENSSIDDYERVIIENFGDNPRIWFIAASEKVNSYDLLEAATSVVAYTSTIGVEAAIFGKPVVTESSAYWANLGFCWVANSRPEYRKYLIKAVDDEILPSKSKIDDALFSYFLTQVCNLVPTNFNPVDLDPAGIKTMASLSLQVEIAQIEQSLTENIPISYIRALKILEISEVETLRK